MPDYKRAQVRIERIGELVRYLEKIADAESGLSAPAPVNLRAVDLEQVMQIVEEGGAPGPQVVGDHGLSRPLNSSMVQILEPHLTFEQFVIGRIEPNDLQTLCATSVRQYRHLTRKYLIPFFGKMWISKVVPADVQMFFSAVSRQAPPSTVRSLRSRLSRIFDAAALLEHVQRNPVRAPKPPLERCTNCDGVSRHQRAFKRRAGRPAVDVDTDRVLRFRNEGLSWRAVAEAMGVPKDTLIRHVTNEAVSA